MRQRRKIERPPDECPECGTHLDATGSLIYLCKNDDEAHRIVNMLRRSVIVKIGTDGKPRRLHIDGTYSPRPDIVADELGGQYWYSGNGLRYEAVRLTWGDHGDGASEVMFNNPPTGKKERK
jgi:hypothetical protein